MAELSNPNNDSDSKLRARLALTGQADITDWKEKEEYLQKRKIEAAKAMTSDEQKKIQDEQEKVRVNREEARKKLAELEDIRQKEEELKKKDISAKQREEDFTQEKLRQEKIRQILESQKEIEKIKQSPQNRLSSFHTLTDDLNKEIKSGSFTATSLARANKQELSEDQKTISWLKIFILTLSFILILGGLTAISWSLLQRATDSQAPTQLTHDSIIFADEHLMVDLNNQSAEQIKQAIKNLYAKSNNDLDLSLNKMKDIYFSYEESRNTEGGVIIERKIASPTIFASSTNLMITDDLLRFLNPNFMLGIYLGPQIEPFYIFLTDAYKNSADALLHNENEIVSQLLSPFIDFETETIIKEVVFQDKMIKNRNVRIVTNQDNRTLAAYAWLDKNTIAITTSEFALEKILNSFLTPKPVVK